MNKKKPKYDEAFKFDAVRMSEPTAQSIAEVAALLGIKPRKLAMWHAQYGHDGDGQYPGNIISQLEADVSSLQAENEALRRRCTRLEKSLAFSTAALKSQIEDG